MKNKGIWIGAGVFLIIILGICAYIARLYDHGQPAWGASIGGNAALRNSTELAVTDNTELEIDCKADNIYFYEGNSDKLVIKEYYRASGQNALAAINQSEGRVSIQGVRKNYLSLFGWFGEGDRVEIYLPVGMITAIDAAATSGNIKSDTAFKGKRLNVTVSSGNITWDRAEAGDVSFQTTSGNIKVTDIRGDARLQASSGNITVSGAQGFIAAKANSGNIKILQLTGGADANVTSGNVTVEADALKGDIYARASSGNITVRVPRDSSFVLQANTSSGNIHTAFDQWLSYNKKGNSAEGNVGEKPDYRIEAKATSGNVKIFE